MKIEMVDLKRSKADMKAEDSAMPADENGEQYPYGCCLSLDTDELDKLGIKELPEIGDEYHIYAVGKVTRISKSAAGGQDESTGMSVQITMMQMVHEDEEPGEIETAAAENAEANSVVKIKSAVSNAYRGK